MTVRNVHLVGSVPLPDARAVFATVSAALGPQLQSIPDGETGERLDWITWLEPVFARHPAFEPSGETFQLHGALARKDKRYRLKPGASIADVASTTSSTRTTPSILRGVRRLEAPGRHPGAREIPGRSGAGAFGDLAYVQEDLHPSGRPLFNDAVLREIDKIAAAIPHDSSRSSSTSRRRCSRGSSATAVELRPDQSRDAGNLRRHRGPARQSMSGGYRSLVSFLLRRRRPQACGRADRHGRHGGVRQPPDGA